MRGQNVFFYDKISKFFGIIFWTTFLYGKYTGLENSKCQLAITLVVNHVGGRVKFFNWSECKLLKSLCLWSC